MSDGTVIICEGGKTTITIGGGQAKIETDGRLTFSCPSQSTVTIPSPIPEEEEWQASRKCW